MHFRRLRMTLTIVENLTRVHVFLVTGPRMIIWPAQVYFAIDRYNHLSKTKGKQHTTFRVTSSVIDMSTAEDNYKLISDAGGDERSPPTVDWSGQ